MIPADSSSKIPAIVTFPALPKTARWWEFLRFPPRLAGLAAEGNARGLNHRFCPPVLAFQSGHPRPPSGPQPLSTVWFWAHACRSGRILPADSNPETSRRPGMFAPGRKYTLTGISSSLAAIRFAGSAANFLPAPPSPTEAGVPCFFASDFLLPIFCFRFLASVFLLLRFSLSGRSGIRTGHILCLFACEFTGFLSTRPIVAQMFYRVKRELQDSCKKSLTADRDADTMRA